MISRRQLSAGLLGVLTTACISSLGGRALAERGSVSPRGKRVALLVGIQNYVQSSLRLRTPLKDAEALTATLTEIGFAVTNVKDPTRNELRQHIANFDAALDNADVGVFYYAGHGMQAVRPGAAAPTNLLMPSDFLTPKVTREERAKVVEESTVSLDLVLRMLRRKARVSLVLLDACRNNPFAQEEIAMAAEQAEARAGRGIVLGRGLARSASATEAEIGAADPASKAPATGPRGMVIAYATQPGRIADDGAGDHSPFTKALLAHLKTPGRVVDQMLRDVATDVDRATQTAQTPLVEASLLGGDFFLVPSSEKIESPRPARDLGPSRPSSRAGSSPSTAPAPQRPVMPQNGGIGGGNSLY